MKEIFALVKIDVRGEEAVKELVKRESTGNHHLQDIIGGVRQESAVRDLDGEHMVEIGGRGKI